MAHKKKSTFVRDTPSSHTGKQSTSSAACLHWRLLCLLSPAMTHRPRQAKEPQGSVPPARWLRSGRPFAVGSCRSGSQRQIPFHVSACCNSERLFVPPAIWFRLGLPLCSRVLAHMFVDVFVNIPSQSCPVWLGRRDVSHTHLPRPSSLKDGRRHRGRGSPLPLRVLLDPGGVI